MFFNAPHNIYGPELLRLFIDELGGVKRVHKYLGVTERSVWRWLSTGRAPRAAVLALYWESKWGRSQIFTDQVNEIRLLYRQVCILQDQYQKAKDIITGLRAMHAGSANEPIYDELPDLSNRQPPTFDAEATLPQTQNAMVPAAAALPAPVSARAARAMQAFPRSRSTAR